jgi:hypothetical protein
MTYGSTVWWHTGGRCTSREHLERVQNRALRLICACFRTTPVYALQLEAAIPPVVDHLDHLTERAAIRLLQLDQAHPLVLRLPDHWRTDTSIPLGSVPLPVEPPRVRPPRIPGTLRCSSTSPRLWNIAAFVGPNAERSDPFAVPPWDDGMAIFDGRFQAETPSPLPEKKNSSTRPR